MNKNRRKQNGFSLVEVMVAMMLGSMVLLSAFPLVRIGTSFMELKQKKLESNVLGNGIFEHVRDELRILETVNPEEDLLEVVCEDIDIDAVETRVSGHGFELALDIENMEPGWAWLRVCLTKDDAVCYEREEAIPMLNHRILEKTEEEKNEKNFIYEE